MGILTRQDASFCMNFGMGLYMCNAENGQLILVSIYIALCSLRTARDLFGDDRGARKIRDNLPGFAGKVNSLKAKKDCRWARRVEDILAGFGGYCRRYPLTWVRVPASPLNFFASIFLWKEL